jgi:hypothetical protein
VSDVFERYADALVAYGEEQGVDRTTLTQDGPPWPEPNNIMLEYLCQVTLEELASTQNITVEDIQEMLVWLAVHSWYEGGIAERARSLNPTQPNREDSNSNG